MTPEAQQIAIAEFVGGRKAKEGWTWPPYSNFLRCKRDTPDGCVDFFNDLNAMHEAEKVLVDDGRWQTYLLELWRIVNPEPRWMNPEPVNVQNYLSRNFVRATAAQRAEAFLRTIGKWVDTVIRKDGSWYRNTSTGFED